MTIKPEGPDVLGQDSLSDSELKRQISGGEIDPRTGKPLSPLAFVPCSMPGEMLLPRSDASMVSPLPMKNMKMKNSITDEWLATRSWIVLFVDHGHVGRVLLAKRHALLRGKIWFAGNT